jgi:hypothetical protein
LTALADAMSLAAPERRLYGMAKWSPSAEALVDEVERA